MSVLMKAVALGLTGAVAALLLKRSVPEMGLAVTAAVCVAAAALAAELMGQLRQTVDLAREQTGLSPAVVTPVLKCVGIGIVTRLGADLCKDAGQSAVATAVELTGAACAMGAALPLVRALLQMISELT